MVVMGWRCIAWPACSWDRLCRGIVLGAACVAGCLCHLLAPPHACKKCVWPLPGVGLVVRLRLLPFFAEVPVPAELRDQMEARRQELVEHVAEVRRLPRCCCAAAAWLGMAGWWALRAQARAQEAGAACKQSGLLPALELLLGCNPSFRQQHEVLSADMAYVCLPLPPFAGG